MVTTVLSARAQDFRELFAIRGQLQGRDLLVNESFGAIYRGPIEKITLVGDHRLDITLSWVAIKKTLNGEDTWRLLSGDPTIYTAEFDASSTWPLPDGAGHKIAVPGSWNGQILDPNTKDGKPLEKPAPRS